ncbi:MAG TPA: NrfD/PsrC family molybdoenzyme membrane anchor subunit, partial [Arenibaculum sp.]|nr:NrfD/PsrC family molybdoenzyme membrane anchor subunit [Arenibaculum sp.]
IYVGGLGGSAQIVATAADLAGGEGARGIVRTGRWLAFAASLAGAPLLIADLKTPQRWYNMLRIFRATSPMSIGSYILSGFGAFSALTATAQLAEDTGVLRHRTARRTARAAQMPAALTGAGMSVYTAALLSATSTPLWAAAPRELAVRFGSAAMASAAAALSLGERAAGRGRMAGALDRLALAACAAELVASILADRRYCEQGVGGVLEEPPWKQVHTAGSLGLAAAVPILCHGLNLAAGQRSRGLSVLGSLAILVGSAAMRHTMLRAGNLSAKRPADYFRMTQPPVPAGIGSGDRLHDRERPARPRLDR